MKLLRTARLGLCLYVGLVGSASAEQIKPDCLDFLSGQWNGFDYADKVFADLYWTKAKAKTYLGCSRHRLASKGSFQLLNRILFIEIGTHDAALARRTFRDGLGTETREVEHFRSEQIEKGKAVFEDSTHQVRLIYERRGKKLLETEVPLKDGVAGKPITITYFKE